MLTIPRPENHIHGVDDTAVQTILYCYTSPFPTNENFGLLAEDERGVRALTGDPGAEPAEERMDNGERDTEEARAGCGVLAPERCSDPSDAAALRILGEVVNIEAENDL